MFSHCSEINDAMSELTIRLCLRFFMMQYGKSVSRMLVAVQRDLSVCGFSLYGHMMSPQCVTVQKDRLVI